MKTNLGLVINARDLAIEAHESVNHKYDGYLPYTFHLGMVVQAANNFIELLPSGDWGMDDAPAIVRAACWMHDVLEDTHLTYNDLVKKLVTWVTNPPNSHEVKSRAAIEIVYAVTNNKGRNRKERANDAYYQGIRETPYATFVKLCDRVANVTYGRLTGGSMVDVYRREHHRFLSSLSPIEDAYAPLVEHLSRITNQEFELNRI